jgi:hypothetical protein
MSTPPASSIRVVCPLTWQRKRPGAVTTTSAVRFRGNGVDRQQIIDAGLIPRSALGVAPRRLAESDERGPG